MRARIRSVFLLAGVGFAGALIALACTGSSDHPPTADDAGASSDGGSGSGSSGGGSSGSSSGGSSGSSSGGSGSSSGGTDAATDAPVVVPILDNSILSSALNDAVSLIVVGSNLYWVEDTDGAGPSGSVPAIKAMPTTGGAPSTVFSLPAYAAGTSTISPDLASDGTSLYFSYQLPNDAGAGAPHHFVKSDLAGGGVVDLVAPDLIQPTGGNYANQAYVVGGLLYVQAQTQGEGTVPVGIPGDGGIMTFWTPTNPNVDSVSALDWVDATGLYYVVTELPTTHQIYTAAPLSGGLTNALYTLDVNSGHAAAGFAVANGEAYVAEYAAATHVSTIHKIDAAGDGGAGTALLTQSTFKINDLVADANGLYATQVESGNPAYPAGIYAVDTTTGALTLVHLDPQGAAQYLALDATNVYWLGADGTLHAAAR